MITARIVGANGKQLKVNGEGELTVTQHTHPPIDEAVESLPFRAYFRNSAGSNNMVTSGSLASPVDYTIDADADFDYFVKTLSVKVADAGAKFNLFGALTALTNGIEFKWKNQATGELIIHDGIKDNLEWYRLSNNDVTTASIIDLSGGGADAVVVHIDLAVLFGNPWGVRLVKGRKDQLIFSVRDNLTGITEFNIIAYGTKI